MSNRLWRTLIRIEGIDQNSVHVVIPAWDHTKTIHLRNDLFPSEILEVVRTGQKYLHASVPIGVDDESLLTFQDWEKE